MAVAYPSSSTVASRSAAISRVSSIGNPWVSCSRNATGPETVPLPSDSSASRIVNPVRSVARKLPSSRAATPMTKSSLRARSG